MSSDRERLIELLDDLGVIVNVPDKVDEDGCGTYSIEGGEYIADHLLANGVIVPPVEVGGEIWVIDRENGEAVDISCVMFLAKSKGFIIATSWINDYDLDETIDFHINETQNNFDTDLKVYLDEDCFATKEQAEQKLKECEG